MCGEALFGADKKPAGTRSTSSISCSRASRFARGKCQADEIKAKRPTSIPASFCSIIQRFRFVISWNVLSPGSINKSLSATPSPCKISLVVSAGFLISSPSNEFVPVQMIFLIFPSRYIRQATAKRLPLKFN